MKFLMIFVVNICLLWSYSIQANTFKIVGIEGAPLRFYDSNQELVGIDVDIIDIIMTRLEVPYEIEIVTSSTRLRHLWESPNVDMILTYSYKAERAKYLNYPAESHIVLGWNFFVLKENLGRINFRNISDLKGLKVGATQGFSYTDEFWQAAEEGLFEIDTVVKNELNMNKLLHGRFDTYANSRIDTLYQAKKGGYVNKISYLEVPLKEKSYFNTFVKASDFPKVESLQKAYDIELKKMRDNGELKAIYSKYLGDTATY